jgi:hypothetical protein
MPNVAGLKPAPSYTKPGTYAYGPHCKVTAYADGKVVLYNRASEGLASLRDGKPGIRLDRLDGDTVTAVNAFLRPFGKARLDWRLRRDTGETVYKWTGSRNVTPVDAPVAPISAPAAPIAAPAAPAAPVATPVVAATGTVNDPFAGIATLRRWSDRYPKQPKVVPVRRTGYSTNGTVIARASDWKRLDAMKVLRDAGEPEFGLITGPAGTAKTTLAVEWAFTHDLPVVVIDGMSIQTATDWYGGMTQTPDGKWVWAWTDAAKAIMTGLPVVIVVDELNRPENERALNGLMPLTDWKGTVSPLGAPHPLTLKPGQMIIATLNEGVEYVGTVEVDAAVRDRLGIGVRMGYVPATVEEQVLMKAAPTLDRVTIKRLVQVAHGQRVKANDDVANPSGATMSTRLMVRVVNLIEKAGMTPAEAIWTAVTSKFTPEDYPNLTNLIEAQFGPDAKPVEDEDLDDEALAEALAHL